MISSPATQGEMAAIRARGPAICSMSAARAGPSGVEGIASMRARSLIALARMMKKPSPNATTAAIAPRPYTRADIDPAQTGPMVDMSFMYIQKPDTMVSSAATGTMVM